VLERQKERRGLPERIVMDNGPEFTSKALRPPRTRRSARRNGAAWQGDRRRSRRARDRSAPGFSRAGSN